MIYPKVGSVWRSGNCKFRVLAVELVANNVWVYYRDEGKTDPREYSCYLISFLERNYEEPAG